MPLEKDVFYYHGDHLGSSNIITDSDGAVYQHLEYFPYGETWIEEGGSYGGNTPGYKFTGKELDPETGLYYFGARYYDPVLSKWISADPILEKYLPALNDKDLTKLPGLGGIYNPLNLNPFDYSHGNPVLLLDPNGAETSKKNIFEFKYTQGLQLGVHLGAKKLISLDIELNLGRYEKDLVSKAETVSQSITAQVVVKKVVRAGLHMERRAPDETSPVQFDPYTGQAIPGTGWGIQDVLKGKPFEIDPIISFGEAGEASIKGGGSNKDFSLDVGYEIPILPSFEGSINLSEAGRRLSGNQKNNHVQYVKPKSVMDFHPSPVEGN